MRIPPPTHSWLRNVLRLPSQVSAHFITSLSPSRALFFLFSLTFPPFSSSPHITSRFIPVPHPVPFYLSARLFRDGSLGRGWHGERSQLVPKLTNCLLETQRVAVEIGSHMARLDLLTLSSSPPHPLLSIISLSVPASRSL